MPRAASKRNRVKAIIVFFAESILGKIGRRPIFALLEFMIFSLKKSLLTQLVTTVSLLSLTTVTIGTITVYFSTRNTISSSVFNQLRIVANLKENELNQWSQTQQQNLEQLAINLVDLLNEQTNINQSLNNYNQINQYLQNALENQSSPRTISLLTQDGKVIVSTDKDLEGSTVATNLEKKPLEIIQVEGKITITFTTPIINQSAQPLAILVMTLNSAEVEDLLQKSAGIDQNSLAYLVVKGENNQTFLVSPLNDNQPSSKKITSLGIQAALAGQNGIGAYENYQGADVLGVYRHWEAGNLALLAEINQQEVFAPAHQLASQIMLMGLGITTLLSLGVYMLARRTTQSIQAITKATVQLTQGNFSYRTPVSSQDEVGRLAQSVNQMAQQILDSVTALQQTNQALARQVQEYSALDNLQPITFNHGSPESEFTPLQLPPGEEQRVLSTHQGGFILIVDDNPHNLSVLSATLKSAGFQVGVEMDGEGVLEQVAYAQPDLILLDINMPGIDGFETCRLLKSNPQTQDIPIIFMTAWTETDNKVKGLSLGAVDYIPKPFEQEEVLARVRLHLKLSSITKTLAKQNLSLEEAKQAAEAASKAKSGFLANMSHELRTPLNAILGYAQVLQRSLNQDNFAQKPNFVHRQLEGLQTIEGSGKHLLTLINDILDFSKIEAQKMKLYPHKINFPAFLGGVADIISMGALEKGLVFEYEPLPDLPKSVLVDDKRLRQILINLLGNAVKFTEMGKITFKVGLSSQEQAQIRFEVADSGVGIAPEELKTIFQPFEQVGDTKHRSGGTGLGLSIAKQLVELMGGKLQVSSELGKGSSFWFELSLSTTFDNTENQVDNEPRGQIIGYQGRKRTILVVDDNQANCSLMSNILEPLGFKVVIAENGQEGLDMARQLQPDLILTDVFMPIKTGFVMALELRQIKGLKDIPIIALSASTLELVQEKSLLAGCAAFLPKPIDQHKLLAALGRYLHLEWITNQVQSD